MEKSQLLSALGAQVQRVRPVSITHPGHFVNVARRVSDPTRGLSSKCLTSPQARYFTYRHMPFMLNAVEHLASSMPSSSISALPDKMYLSPVCRGCL